MFTGPPDIVNRALQHVGGVRITALTDNSKNAAESSFLYDKCRRAELRANLWNFSARRCILRKFIATPISSLQAGSTQVWAAPSWSNVIGYGVGAVVQNAFTEWVGVIGGNLNNIPGAAGTGTTQNWQEYCGASMINIYDPAQTYYAGEMTTLAEAPGNAVYITPALVAASPPGNGWILTQVTTQTPSIFQPLGLTRNNLTAPKTAYPLPNNYIRVMPQDPKTAAAPAQLSSAGMQTTDFEFEGGFLFTNATGGGPLLFRYAADLQIVEWFDDLFCETLACRIAMELCEIITQSPQKLEGLHSLYEEYITKAIRVNAIEAGSTEPDTMDVDSQRGPTREKAPPQPKPQQR